MMTDDEWGPCGYCGEACPPSWCYDQGSPEDYVSSFPPELSKAQLKSQFKELAVVAFVAATSGDYIQSQTDYDRWAEITQQHYESGKLGAGARRVWEETSRHREERRRRLLFPDLRATAEDLKKEE